MSQWKMSKLVLSLQRSLEHLLLAASIITQSSEAWVFVFLKKIDKTNSFYSNIILKIKKEIPLVWKVKMLALI